MFYDILYKFVIQKLMNATPIKLPFEKAADVDCQIFNFIVFYFANFMSEDEIITQMACTNIIEMLSNSCKIKWQQNNMPFKKSTKFKGYKNKGLHNIL